MPGRKKISRKPVTTRQTGNSGKNEVESAVNIAQSAVARKMGVSVSQLSPEIVKNIDSAVKSSLDARMQTLIHHDAEKAVKETVLAGTQPLEALDSRISAAQAGVRFVSTDAKVEAVLDDTAHLLWKKYQALIKAGFSEQQSFDLLLAEVTGRASRNK
jgi:hypothetical protein